MNINELDFEYPEELIALKPVRPTRVMWVGRDQNPREITTTDLLSKLGPGDVLVLNETKVSKRRVFGELPGGEKVEVLFVENVSDKTWKVLCPAKRIKKNKLMLPESLELEILESGRPQLAGLSHGIQEDYFLRNGETPLPPYIRSLRDSQRADKEDEELYQPKWASVVGSSASPTASLHFSLDDIQTLKSRGIVIAPVVLHVGLGTYLPVDTENLEEFKMHGEQVQIPTESWEKIRVAKEGGNRVWCLGTTSVRAVESASQGLLNKSENGFVGVTHLKILPGFKFQICDVLMTNFHQPKTTLMALVAAFAGLDSMKKAYQWAIEKGFGFLATVISRLGNSGSYFWPNSITPIS